LKVTVRAWEIAEFGRAHLRLVERPEPEPGLREVVVATRACSINYRDVLMVDGKYDPRLRLPVIPLSDGAGEVVAVGPGVSRVAVGDRVVATFAPKWIAGAPTRAAIRETRGGPLDGTLAERFCVSEDELVRMPAHLGFAEAATLPCAGLTAWTALAVLGGVKAGDTVLVQGTGGVSIFGLQLGQLLGARVIVTSSRDDKLARARDLGAWHTINYRSHADWGKRASGLAGDGVDHVLEVGGAGTLAQSLRAVRTGGTISVIGNLTGAATELNLVRVLMNAVRLQGILVGSRESLESLCRAVEAHELRPVVDRSFPFEDAPAALEHLSSAAHFGKITVTSEGPS
jgi:NADPH:quinone reductase-like Zn-dependent oxidoreductase